MCYSLQDGFVFQKASPFPSSSPEGKHCAR
jgi:hypothetical protein